MLREWYYPRADLYVALAHADLGAFQESIWDRLEHLRPDIFDAPMRAAHVDSIEFASWRGMVHLPEKNTVGYVALDEEATARLKQEARLVDKLKTASASWPFDIVGVDSQSEDGSVQLRKTFSQSHHILGADFFRKADDKGKKHIAREMGKALGYFHGHLNPADFSEWALPLPWEDGKNDIASIREYFNGVAFHDRNINKRIDRLLDYYQAAEKLDRAPVLNHGDYILSNVVFDRRSSSLVNVFDFEKCAINHRYHDFRFMFRNFSDVQWDAFAQGYAETSGTEINRGLAAIYALADQLSIIAQRDPADGDESLETDLSAVREITAGLEAFEAAYGLAEKVDRRRRQNINIDPNLKL